MNAEDAGLARAQASRAVVHQVDDSTGSQLLDIETHEGITRSDVEVLQPYGLASRPAAGALTVVIAIGGDPTDLVALPPAGGVRYGVEVGEVALYNDELSRVHLRTGGFVDVTAATEVNVKVGGTVFRVTADGVEITGNLAVAGNITATGTVSDGAGDLRS